MPSPAELLRATWSEIGRNRLTVLSYCAARAALVALYFTLALMLDPGEEGISPPWLPALAFALELLVFAAMAALTAALFTLIGRELGKPLWKVETPMEGVRRFFMPWYLLFLITLLTARVAVLGVGTAGESASWSMLLVGIPFLSALAIPVGAGIMFLGRFEWHELGEATAPLIRQSGSVVMLVLLGSLVYFFLNAASLAAPREQIAVQIVLDMIWAATDCLLFIGAWLVCQFDRDNPDTDFDF